MVAPKVAPKVIDEMPARRKQRPYETEYGYERGMGTLMLLIALCVVLGGLLL